MSWPAKCVVDTNVPITANKALSQDEVDPELIPCIEACLEAIERVISSGGLVLDDGDEIYDEYLHQLSLRGMPGLGDRFMKWVHDHRWNPRYVDRVPITSEGDSYKEFPDHPGLKGFDRSDRKFVAVACAHREKPTILQATDSKWWGWKGALAEVGVTVKFLCPEYVEEMWKKKMGA